MPSSAMNPSVTADHPRSATATENPAGKAPALEIEDLRIRYGKVEAVKGISFTVTPGEFLTLLGPSGCGKTTTLRCIAGLEAPSAGVVRIDGLEVANARRQLPPQRRGINMVFQSYAVWPHMTVEQNVAYGLYGRKLPRKEIRERTERALELVGLGEYRKRYGTELSGGQQQRVAVARAVVTDPKIILLDEPLSNLDAGLRERMREELLSLHRRIGRTAIYVTHDQSEAMAMSDRIILMKDGTIEQIASPRELYAAPQSRFAADFVGTTNVLLGSVVYQDGQAVFHESSGAMKLVLGQGAAAENCLVLFRPELVQLDGAITTTVNRFDLQVTNVAFLGNRCDVTGTIAGVRLRVEAPADFRAAPQSVVPIAFPPTALRCLPNEPG